MPRRTPEPSRAGSRASASCTAASPPPRCTTAGERCRRGSSAGLQRAGLSRRPVAKSRSKTEWDHPTVCEGQRPHGPQGSPGRRRATLCCCLCFSLPAWPGLGPQLPLRGRAVSRKALGCGATRCRQQDGGCPVTAAPQCRCVRRWSSCPLLPRQAHARHRESDAGVVAGVRGAPGKGALSEGRGTASDSAASGAPAAARPLRSRCRLPGSGPGSGSPAALGSCRGRGAGSPLCSRWASRRPRWAAAWPSTSTWSAVSGRLLPGPAALAPARGCGLSPKGEGASRTLGSGEQRGRLCLYSQLGCSHAPLLLLVAVLDIPVYKSRLPPLHVLFSLYSEFKNSQVPQPRAAAGSAARLLRALRGGSCWRGAGGPQRPPSCSHPQQLTHGAAGAPQGWAGALSDSPARPERRSRGGWEGARVCGQTRSLLHERRALALTRPSPAAFQASG